MEPFLPPGIPADAGAIIAGKAGDPHADIAFVDAQIKRLHPLPSRMHWALSPSGPQRCSRPLLEGIAELSERCRLPVTTHVYETRAQLAKARSVYPQHQGSLINYMDAVGLLTPRTSICHSVYITRAEIEQLARAGAGVVHNPLSNLKLKNGVAPLLDIKRAGINLALGCDNCSCSDCQNLFQAMKAFTLFCAGMDGEPTGVHASDAIEAATLSGARALGLAGEIGEVRAGMKADLVLIDLSDFSYLPFNSAARQLVYSETGRAVHTVLVDGKVVLENCRLATIDEAEFRRELAEVMQIADRDYIALARRQGPAVSYLLEGNRALTAAPLGLSRFVGGATN
jgi:5-methylthioadenosine/S-adenosylhomocysteine deaminase